MIGKHGGTKTKLSALSLGIGIGLATALYMLVFGWIALFWGYGTPMIESFSSLYIGYAPTFLGGIIGALWGFVDGFIFGILIGWFYNLCMCCCCKKCEPEEK